MWSRWYAAQFARVACNALRDGHETRRGRFSRECAYITHSYASTCHSFYSIVEGLTALKEELYSTTVKVRDYTR